MNQSAKLFSPRINLVKVLIYTDFLSSVQFVSNEGNLNFTDRNFMKVSARVVLYICSTVIRLKVMECIPLSNFGLR